MKKLLLSLICSLFLSTAIFAQAHTEIELIRSAYKLEKKAVVAEYLALANEDAGKFWPIYEKYEQDRSKIGDRRLKLIEDYVNGRHKAAAKDADAMVKESASIQKEEASLREKYYATVRDGVSLNAALDFFEIEDIIATTVKMKLWEEMKMH